MRGLGGLHAAVDVDVDGEVMGCWVGMMDGSRKRKMKWESMVLL
jgi:hypothetical protein